MPSLNNILEPVWETYQTTRDCLKITSKSISKNQFAILRNTKFAGNTVDAAELLISDSRKNAEDFVILSLWAVFERKLLEYIQNKGKKLLGTTPTIFCSNLHQKIERDMEYWKSNDLLELFKPVAGHDLVGKAKQVKQYRDWIAHKNPNKPSPANVLPLEAYKILSAIITTIEQHPDFKKGAVLNDSCM